MIFLTNDWILCITSVKSQPNLNADVCTHTVLYMQKMLEVGKHFKTFSLWEDCSPISNPDYDRHLSGRPYVCKVSYDLGVWFMIISGCSDLTKTFFYESDVNNKLDQI